MFKWFQHNWKNWTNMLDDVGPTHWLMLDQHRGWCWSNMLDDTGPACLIYCKSAEDTLQYTFLTWYFNDFNQQHSNKIPIHWLQHHIYKINNLQTSTEQLVLNPLTHKWKSCASPKVTKTWHNLFKKRYCLSSNSAVTDLLKIHKEKIIY